MATSSNPHEVDHLRDRVRLYLQVMLVIDVYAYVSDFVMPLLIGGLGAPELPLAVAVMRHGVTVVLLGGWLFTKLARPTKTVLMALEMGVTLALTLVYINLGVMFFQSIMPAIGPVFGLVGVLLLLVVRASLVPSPVGRTVFTGVVALALWLGFAKPTLDTLPPVVFDGLTFMAVAFVVATAATSHVIYGLRRQVRQAMRLGQYELGRKLGEGGMGEVYQATHLMLRRPTAIKLLPPDKVGEHTVARFEREVQQTSRLEHPNSVHIYDYGHTPDGLFYYAMEYLDGLTLAQLVDREGPIAAARVVPILHQAASALAEAHAMGLVHRDIKPANIMLCERAGVPDTVKVLDFGLVKEVENPQIDADITNANTIVGTPHYLAPEAIAHPDAVGPPADLYALGATAFYLLTGREVFPADTVIEVCSKHLNVPPEAPSSVLGHELDADLEALILRCLAKDAADRPEDGAALARALSRLDVPGWTIEQAQVWWRDFRQASGSQPSGASPPTQLAVDVAGRR